MQGSLLAVAKHAGFWFVLEHVPRQVAGINVVEIAVKAACDPTPSTQYSGTSTNMTCHPTITTIGPLMDCGGLQSPRCDLLCGLVLGSLRQYSGSDEVTGGRQDTFELVVCIIIFV